MKPILSLRLLGRLDEELSCANSRFFRTTLYPDARVTRLVKERFTFEWKSVRPVPIVTIDFGDGRILKRTLTGNSVHLVLDARGRPVDALPGLFDAPTFTWLAGAAADLAAATVELDGNARLKRLADWHQSRRTAILRAWSADLGVKPDVAKLEAASTDAAWERMAAARAGDALPSNTAEILRRFPSAREAGEIARTKRMVERPLLDQLEPLARTIAEDSLRNQYRLHRRVHERFATGAPVGDADAFTAWIYEELFLMPLDDPWLGLRSAAYAGLTE
jgi:hypothetical protein